MKIEVGEYVKTKQGDIDKVILEYAGKCANPNCSAKHISCKSNYYDEEDIVKHSKNIIDLIEVRRYSKNWSRYNFFKCFRNPRKFRLF